MKTHARPVKLPTEEQIRERLTHLATEANSLRRLLRIVRRKPSIESQNREVQYAHC